MTIFQRPISATDPLHGCFTSNIEKGSASAGPFFVGVLAGIWQEY